MRSGYDIAAGVDPNVSDDVCTFCKHGTVSLEGATCALGFTGYFRSLSNYGPIYVSDCGKGEMRPELAAIDKNKDARE
jgi:hypothetical protein